jgi:hypothetical protein
MALHPSQLVNLGFFFTIPFSFKPVGPEEVARCEPPDHFWG